MSRLKSLYERLYFLEKNGIAHGLFTAGFMVLAWMLIPSYYAVGIVGALCVVYYYQREAKARKTLDIRRWYTDSQLDAITPAVVALLIAYLYYR